MKKFLLFFSIIFISSLLLFADERADILNGLTTLEKSFWTHTFNPRQRDQQYYSFDNEYLLHNNKLVTSLAYMQATELDQKLHEMIDFDLSGEVVKEVLDSQNVSNSQGISDGIFSILKNMTFQERRLSMNFLYDAELLNWHLSLQTSYGLCERNFWLDVDLREKLMNLSAKAFPNWQGDFDVNDFLWMKTGLGDTRLRATYPIVLTDSVFVEIGPQIIIPTADKTDQLTLGKTLEISRSAVFSFLFDRAKEVFIAPTFGNNGHYAIGAYLHGHINYKNLELFGAAEADYLLPSTENKFFMRKNETPYTDSTGETFSSFQDYAYGLISDEVTEEEGDVVPDTIVTRYMEQYLYPAPVMVNVWPKWSYVLTAGLKYMWRPYWSFYTGVDFYHKDEELIYAFEQGENRELYNITQEVRRGVKEQSKVFFGITYDGGIHNMWLMGSRIDEIRLSLGLGGAVSFHARGVGHDFQVSLNAGAEF